MSKATRKTPRTPTPQSHRARTNRTETAIGPGCSTHWKTSSSRAANNLSSCAKGTHGHLCAEQICSQPPAPTVTHRVKDLNYGRKTIHYERLHVPPHFRHKSVHVMCDPDPPRIIATCRRRRTENISNTKQHAHINAHKHTQTHPHLHMQNNIFFVRTHETVNLSQRKPPVLVQTLSGGGTYAGLVEHILGETSCRRFRKCA